METRIWFSYFVISKCSDYPQNYLMQLKQCGHKVAKDQVVITWLDEDQIHVCLVTWLEYSFAVTQNCFYFPLSTLSILKQYVLHCIRYWAGSCKVYKTVGNFYWWERSGILISPCKKLQTNKASSLVYKDLAKNCAKQWICGLQWISTRSS